MDRLDRITALVRRHVPGLRIVCKSDVPWMSALGVALWPLVPDFHTRFATVLGNTVYLPTDPAAMPRQRLARVLAHELVHQLDMQRYGAGFYLTYVLSPLPFGRTERARWERRAYAVDLMLALENGGPDALQRAHDRLVPLFAGSTYGWMWAGTRAARAFLAPTLAEVRAGQLQQREPYRSILAAWRGEELEDACA